MATFVPIIIPTQSTRECIVQNGQKFCEANDPPSMKEVGAGLFVGLLIVLWVCFVMWFSAENYEIGGRIMLLGLGGPVVLVALGLILFG